MNRREREIHIHGEQYETSKRYVASGNAVIDTTDNKYVGWAMSETSATRWAANLNNGR